MVRATAENSELCRGAVDRVVLTLSDRLEERFMAALHQKLLALAPDHELVALVRKQQEADKATVRLLRTVGVKVAGAATEASVAKILDKYPMLPMAFEGLRWRYSEDMALRAAQIVDYVLLVDAKKG